MVFHIHEGDPIPAFRSYAIPLIHHNQIVGVFVLGKSFARKEQILTIVQNVIQTYLLGINASIDASRAGTYGKSFEVVAQEIESLSQTIKESISQIDNILTYLSKSITIVTNGLTF